MGKTDRLPVNSWNNSGRTVWCWMRIYERDQRGRGKLLLDALEGRDVGR